jgi:tRNA threonylcarbamoyl adenosine modification protein YeaZ
MAERFVLALDGSTHVCTAALLCSGESEDDAGPVWEVVARRSRSDGRGQAKLLLGMVDGMLQDVGGGPELLGAIVAGTGPGTFTGVRIAVATGRALALALAVPIVGVSTLSALAARGLTGAGSRPAEVVQGADRVVSVVDARRGQVFFGVYDNIQRADGTRVRMRRDPFGVCDRDRLAEVLPSGSGGLTVVAAERGASIEGLPSHIETVVADVGAEYLVMGQGWLEEPGPQPQGRHLVSWLVEALSGTRVSGDTGWSSGEHAEGGTGTPESVTPVYVRSPDADIHITKMKDPWER